MMRITLAALLFAAACLPAAAQSSTATTGTTTKPMQTAPSSAAQPNGQPKVVIPPAARAGKKGLRVGEGAVNGEPIEIKRKK